MIEASLDKNSETLGSASGLTHSAIGWASFWKSRFNDAQRATGGTLSYDWVTGGCRVRIHLAGPALKDALLVSLEHLLEPPSADKPHLVLHLWDVASTGIEVRPEHDLGRDESPNLEEDQRVVARYGTASRVVRAISESGDQAWWTVPDASHLHYHCRDTPLREYLHAALLQVGMVLIHAAAVDFCGSGVLLIGPSGSGKSTAVLACLNSDLGIVSEDFTALRPGATPLACGIYSTVKVLDEALKWFPDLVPHVSNPGHLADEKNIIYLHRVRPGVLLRETRLKAVLIVSRNPAPTTTIIPARRSDLLRTLASSTIQLMENIGSSRDGATLLAAQAELLRQLPCYCLLMGRDLAEIPATILNLLRQL